MAGEAASGAATGAALGSFAGPIGTIAGAAIGGIGSYFSGKSAADYAEYSQKHRYRWMVNDLKKAGLNPMLAVSQSPGSPPQPDFPDIGEGMLKGSSAVQQARLLNAQVKSQNQAFELANAQTNKTIGEGQRQEMDNLILQASPEYQNAKKTLGDFGEVRGPSAAAAERYDASTQQIKAAAEKAVHEAATAKLTTAITQEQLSQQEIRTKFAPVLAEIEKQYRSAIEQAATHGIKAAEADAQFWDITGPWGRIGSVIKHLIGK